MERQQLLGDGGFLLLVCVGLHFDVVVRQQPQPVQDDLDLQRAPHNLRTQLEPIKEVRFEQQNRD